MSVLTGLFNIFALLYIFRAVQLTIQIGRDWSTIRQEPLTRAKQRLAEQAAFFVGVPPAVLVHELAHALAVWLFGGQVVEFGYRVFWGYVVPSGEFTPIEDWIIAIAGTLGSLAFGAAIWWLLRRNESRTLRYFGLRAFRFQIYFSLLYYPIFTLILPIGDWRTIYDFRATPLLSGVTLLVHAVALLAFWRVDRAGGFEMPAAESPEDQRQLQAVAAAAAAGDPRAQLQWIDSLRRGGAPHQAQTALKRFLAENPNSAEGHLQLAVARAGNRGGVSRDAAEAAQRALSLGLRNPEAAAYAHELLAAHHLERGDGQAAAAEMDAALAAGDVTPATEARLHGLRSQAYRRLRRYEEAYLETQQAVVLAERAGDEGMAAHYRSELDVIEKNAGTRLGPSVPEERDTSYAPPRL